MKTLNTFRMNQYRGPSHLTQRGIHLQGLDLKSSWDSLNQISNWTYVYKLRFLSNLKIHKFQGTTFPTK